LLTVPEAAKRVGRSPETVRRWIRSGRLPARKVGTQHVIDELELEETMSEQLPLPAEWRLTEDGDPMPNIVAVIRESRAGR